jgi:cytochrome P450
MTTTNTLPAGPKSPAAVQLLHWIFRPIPFMHDCARRYGECFTVRLPQNPPFVMFSTPEAVKEIFTGDPEQLPAGKTREILRPLVGQHSLLLLDGARHTHHRRLMTPPFHGERMHAYGQIMREITDRNLDSWPTGRAFPIHTCMQEITLDVILRTVFGVDEGAEQGRLRKCLADMLTLGANPIRLIPFFQRLIGFFTKGQQIVQLLQEMDDLLYAQIAQRRQQGGAGREDILSLLVEARDEDGRPMSDEELRDEMVTMLVAGHETTATSLAWTFHCILERPEVMDRLRAEIRAVVGSGPVEPQHISQLEYLDATIKETQRVYPIVPIVGRLLHEPLRLGGQDLPAGVMVAPCIYLTHHSPDIWPEPDTFDPDRFLAKRVSPYEFFPFGGGIRHCIGAAFALYEMKIVLAQVLSRANLRAAPGRRVRLVRRGITFAPSAGMPVVCDALAA